MSIENNKTIQTYEKYANEYIKQSSSDEATEKLRQQMLKNCLSDLPKDATIFEIGSASGKDAIFFQTLGYTNITVSDIAEPFLKTLQKAGFAPLKFDVAKDGFPGKYDFIYCWAVLMHLTKKEAEVALQRIFNALNNHGKLLMCVKTSDNKKETWVDFNDTEDAKMYFSYWSEDELKSYLKSIGFKKIEIWKYGYWLDCMARK